MSLKLLYHDFSLLFLSGCDETVQEKIIQKYNLGKIKLLCGMSKFSDSLIRTTSSGLFIKPEKESNLITDGYLTYSSMNR